MLSLAVIMTVFNRKDKTRVCIDSLINEINSVQCTMDFYITNDGSTDGTHELLEFYKKKSSRVSIIELKGSGKLFWNKGMYVAYGEALKNDYDFYLWVNNDVEFENNFLSGVITDYSEAQKLNNINIICGSVRYKGTNDLSYGGALNLSKNNPYKRNLLNPTGNIQECDCINGNFLLIPHDTAKLIGNTDNRYEHGFGDFDYGYRLKEKGGTCFVTSQFVGECNRNEQKGTWKDPSISIKKRITLKNRPTGQPPYSHKIFLKKWFPTLWWFYWISPYINIVLSSLKYKVLKSGVK